MVPRDFGLALGSIGSIGTRGWTQPHQRGARIRNVLRRAGTSGDVRSTDLGTPMAYQVDWGGGMRMPGRRRRRSPRSLARVVRSTTSDLSVTAVPRPVRRG